MNDTIQKTMTTAANDAKAQFEAFAKSFEPFLGQDGAKKAAETGAENLRAASESVKAVAGEMEQISASLTQHFATSMAKAFEAQAKMLTAGGWQQALEIQYAYLNDSMDSSFTELSRLTDRGTSLLTKAGAPLQSRFDSMVKNA